jgi:hypothetical protein
VYASKQMTPGHIAVLALSRPYAHLIFFKRISFNGLRAKAKRFKRLQQARGIEQRLPAALDYRKNRTPIRIP